MFVHKLAFLGLCLFVGCTRIPKVDDRYISSLVTSRIDKEVCWQKHCFEKEQIQNRIANLLEQPLTVDSAVQIALFHNPEIQATFEEVGIAQADFVEAGLFTNPVFDAFYRFPARGSQINAEFSIVQSFLDLLLVPLRKRVAAAELEQTQLRVANAILEVSFEVQETFYSLQAEQEKYNLYETILEITEAASQLALWQKNGGNINDLEFQYWKKEYLESKVELSKSQAALVLLREKINQLLGLECYEIHWRISDPLAPLPQSEISLECLEEIALLQRLDLEVIRWEMEKIARIGATKQWWSYTELAAGVSTETDIDGTRVTGPMLTGAIPIFNYGQADRARLLAMYRKSYEHLRMMELTALSEVRSARSQQMIYRDLLLAYQEELLPLQEEIVNTSQKFYHVMGLKNGVYGLLYVKRQQLQLQIDYTMALLNYWISRVKLDRALGGNLYLAFATQIQDSP